MRKKKRKIIEEGPVRYLIRGIHPDSQQEGGENMYTKNPKFGISKGDECAPHKVSFVRHWGGSFQRTVETKNL